MFGFRVRQTTHAGIVCVPQRFDSTNRINDLQLCFLVLPCSFGLPSTSRGIRMCVVQDVFVDDTLTDDQSSSTSSIFIRTGCTVRSGESNSYNF